MTISRSRKWREQGERLARLARDAPSVYFPEPYPGEALYSIIARLRQHTGMTHSTLSWSIFGEEIRVFAINLPFRIEAVARRIPDRMALDSKTIAVRHTGFPYYTAYMDNALKKRVLTEMIGTDGNAVRTAGARARPVTNTDFLRFCAECNMEAVRKYGEAYWRQVHQLPIVTICPDHGLDLQKSSLPSGFIKSFATTDEDTCPPRAPTVIPRNAPVDRTLLFQLALDARELQQGIYPKVAPKNYRAAQFKTMLGKAGILTPRGYIRYDRFHEDVDRVLNGLLPVFPELRQGSVAGPWILRFREGKAGHHPDRTLLMAHALERLAA